MRLSRRFSRAAAALAVLSLAGSAPLAAQSPNPQCVNPAGGDACQRAVDLFTFMTPQIGTLVAGGNAGLGQADVLGGLGRFTVGLRANFTGAFALPNFDDLDLDTGPARQRTIAVDESAAGFPVLDAAFGLFPGMPLGITRAGGVDALVNVFYVPGGLLGAGDEDDFAISLPDGGLKLGWGLRVGLIGETPVSPAVSFTYIRRGLPALDLAFNNLVETGLPGASFSDSLSLRGFALETSAWRIVAGKKLALLSVAAGYGRDRYTSEGRLSYVVDDGDFRVGDSLDFAPTATASNLFLDLTLGLGGFHIGGEIGRVNRSGISTYNSFTVPATGSANYAVIGIRIGH